MNSINIKIIFTFLTFILFSLSAHSQLLDKIVVVFNDQTVSLTQIQRIQENMVARVNISPQIYNRDNYTKDEIVDKVIEKFLIRERLSEMGYNVTDSQVESQIRQTESRLGLTRDDLLQFLEANNTNFNEYFEIIRETIEFNIFNSRVIEPLINITEQEIKNAYYQRYVDSQTVSFNYHLISFSIPKSQVTDKMLDEFTDVLKTMQNRGHLPERFRNISSSDLGKVTEDGMSDIIQQAVQGVEQEEFTQPILIGDNYHVFYIKEKDLVESGHYRNVRQDLQNQLYEQAFESVSSLWFQRQSNRHFIKVNL